MADNPPRDPRNRTDADLSAASLETAPRRKSKAAAQHKIHDMAFLAERGLLPQPETLQPSRPTAQAA